MTTPVEVFLTGFQVNLNLDRDTSFALTISSEAGEILSDPLLEIQRSRTRGRITVPALLIPVPEVSLSGLSAVALFTEEMTAGLNDLVASGKVAFFRYRFRAKSEGGLVYRSYVAGVMAVGPIGYAQSTEDVAVPFTIETGDIVIGGTFVDPGGEAGDFNLLMDSANNVLVNADGDGLLWSS